MPLLAERFRARSATGFQAYCRLQAALLAHWIARGHTPEEFVKRLAPCFRERYGGLLDP